MLKILLLDFGQVKIPFALIDGLQPITFLLYVVKLEMDLPSPSQDDHLFVIHRFGVNPRQFERDLALIRNLSILRFVVQEQLRGEHKVPLFVTTCKVDPFLDKAFFDATAKL